MHGREPFRDRLPEDFSRQGINPYVESHRHFGPELLPASEAVPWRGRWHELYGRVAPLHLEIGAGNGFYLSGMAALHRDWDWLGIEIRFKRVELVARKLRQAGLTNARIARYDAWALHDLFTPGSLAGVHINHPDPWARESRREKRLIGRPFLDYLTPLVAVGAELRLKTDFAPHVDALVEAAVGSPWEVLARVDDLDRDGAPWPDEITTNYQRKARARGAPVLAARLRLTESGSSSTSASEPLPQP